MGPQNLTINNWVEKLHGTDYTPYDMTIGCFLFGEAYIQIKKDKDKYFWLNKLIQLSGLTMNEFGRINPVKSDNFMNLIIKLTVLLNDKVGPDGSIYFARLLDECQII